MSRWSDVVVEAEDVSTIVLVLERDEFLVSLR
jgi:hypothetical protein